MAGTSWDPTSAEAAYAAEHGIHCLSIPTPFAVGRVNLYLIDDEPLTLLDTGPNSGRALDELEQALARLGRRIEDLELLLVSHQHMDHLGLVDILARRSGAQVAALAALAPWMARWSEQMEADDVFAEELMRMHGIPPETRLALRAVSHAYRGWGAAARVTRPLADGEPLELKGRTLHVHHRPGHSPSDTVFHDRERRLLLGGDHLIAHISSNPLVTRPLDAPLDGSHVPRPRSLMIYLESLRATRAMDDVDIVLPGHGEAFGGQAALIDERFRMHERRARKICGMLAERPMTVFEVAQAMWGTVAVTQAYLTISEVLGHIDLLLEDGRVREEVDGAGVARYRSGD